MNPSKVPVRSVSAPALKQYQGVDTRPGGGGYLFLHSSLLLRLNRVVRII